MIHAASCREYSRWVPEADNQRLGQLERGVVVLCLSVQGAVSMISRRDVRARMNGGCCVLEVGLAGIHPEVVALVNSVSTGS